MPRFLLTLFLVCGLAAATAAPAQDAPLPLGKSHFAFEMGAMTMQHRTFDTDDAGMFVGISGYGHMGRNWYLGGEAAAGASMTFFFNDESSVYPLELNAKRAFALTGFLAADLGAGLSYNKVEFRRNSIFSTGEEVTIGEWVFGGQVFGDLMLKAGGLFLGLKVKYQLTTDANEVADLISPDDGWDYSNLRISAQLGFLIPN